ncbi:MAG: pyrroloquinoline quinone-dependent dehydrogenase [Acidobacteria bacterium]|nr:pyrroloquinoline quinone-dependent dehydrogenase [Acidobacteriota bacterium]MYD72230.1 pyrroloquinoline quinone-dependent dehydrogenase [Acidobacteriota bacterium]MYJ04077.1 pyrroloquinoline quinone-dependent dehydrogenase [Acidobacteriota bacterium]
MTARRATLALAAAFFASVAIPASAAAQQGAPNGEWTYYGGDVGGTKYSGLDQIDATNFNDLKIAWRWQSADAGLDLEALREIHEDLSLGNLKVTPLMVGGVVYVVTPLRLAVALDAGTGETIWVHNPEVVRDTKFSINSSNFSSRGGAYWRDGSDEFFYYGTPDGYLLALDARTGQPAAGFGDNGRVDLAAELPRNGRGRVDWKGHPFVSVNSPPLVARGVIVTPLSISDQPIAREQVPGWVQGVDARTGETRWMFKTVPESDDFGVDTWGGDSWRYTGGANVWSAFAADEELGFVYLPTGTPTNDYYGGHRPGDNLFAESIVALDIETGARQWYFQAVHHGVWDYDFPTHPNLVDVTVDGRPVKMLAQISKQGFTYVFDRVTGEPVWPIEERPVETDTDLPGEVLAPTQPFPTRPAPFEYQGSSIDDLVDFTPELREMAVEAVRNHRLGGLFSPPMLSVEGGMQGTIQRPALAGGANWGGSAVDPETGILYVPSVNAYSILKYVTPEEEGSDLNYTQGGFQTPSLMPQGLPLFKPPYSRMTAIDLNTGDHAWMRPNGDGDRFRNHPRLRDLDLPPVGGDGRGGPVLTKTLLVSALSAGGENNDGGPRLIARDKATGEIVGSLDLPGGAIGTPMTYLHEGRQYIALTVGGDVPELVAFALPD